MLVVLEPVARGYFLLGREAPTRGPVLGLHLLAPAQCADAVVEFSKPNRMAVDEPHDGHSIQPRPNDGMRRLSTSAPHTPHNGRLVICRLHRGVGHAPPRGKRDAISLMLLFSPRSHQTDRGRPPMGRQRWRSSRSRGTLSRGNAIHQASGEKETRFCRPTARLSFLTPAQRQAVA